MPRFLFWNYRYEGRDREKVLAELVRDLGIDVIILAEASVDEENLIALFGAGGRAFHRFPEPHEWIKIYAGYPAGCFPDWIRDEGRLCLRGVRFPGCKEMILGAVHLDSGLYTERVERFSHAVAPSMAVRDIQRDLGHARIVVVGDFNLNPFDDGMIFPTGFGAMTSKALVKKAARGRGKDRFARFYNPAWRLLGRSDADGPPGTYYWDKHREYNIYWNSPDQVLVGHDLLDLFPDDRFLIPTSMSIAAETKPLYRPTSLHWKVDAISDHLPLIFDLNLPMETADA